MELTQQNSQPYHIFIVDDIVTNIELLAQVLRIYNIKVSYATRGAEAINSQVLPMCDLILLDISMPEMDGFATCKKLKQNPETKDIPIIFLTARIDQKDIIKGFEYGAVDYMIKPINNKELISRVMTQVELKRSRDKQSEYIRIIEDQNRQLEEQNRHLKALNLTKVKIYSIIAHDLTEPFNGLIGCSDYLITRFDKMEQARIRDMLQVINLSAKEGYTQLENLLNWTRIQVGSLSCNPQIINLQKIVAEVIDLFTNKALDKKITIRTEIAADVVCYADTTMIQTVLRNLLSNALKFTDKDGTVTIAAKQITVSTNKKMVEVSISDTGIGISDENQIKLFTLEQDFTNQGTANEKGTGLGLLLCKEFVEKNGGTIYCKSKINVGSKFFFTVPMK